MAVYPMPAAIVTVQPEMFRTPPDLKTEMWSSGICDCFEDVGICCFGLWCPCCLACQLSAEYGESLCLPLVDIMAFGCVPAASMALRSSMRERYHIQGTMCKDCCMVTCCGSLAWCQMARELKLRKKPLLLQASSTLQVTMHHQYPPYAQPTLQPAMAHAMYPPLPQ